MALMRGTVVSVGQQDALEGRCHVGGDGKRALGLESPYPLFLPLMGKTWERLGQQGMERN